MTYTRALMRKGGCFFALLFTLMSSSWAAGAAAANKVQLKVRALTGKETVIEVEPNATVQDVKKAYYDLVGLPPDLQRLVFKGKQLEDNLQLSDYHDFLQPEEIQTIHLIQALTKRIPTRVTALEGAVDLKVNLPFLSLPKVPTVGEVKKTVYNSLRIPADKRGNLVLAFDGQEFPDDYVLTDVMNMGPLELRLKNGNGAPPQGQGGGGGGATNTTRTAPQQQARELLYSSKRCVARGRCPIGRGFVCFV